jgi:hypothetical protein
MSPENWAESILGYRLTLSVDGNTSSVKGHMRPTKKNTGIRSIETNSKVQYTRSDEVSRCRWKQAPKTEYREPRLDVVAYGQELKKYLWKLKISVEAQEAQDICGSSRYLWKLSEVVAMKLWPRP